MKAEYKKIDKLLYSYKHIDGAILQYDLKIKAVKNDIIGCSAIRYDKEKLASSYNINNSVENEVIERERKIEELEIKRNELIIRKKQLEAAINNLNSNQLILFNHIYINKQRWTRDRIISEMHISKDTYYKWKDEIVYSVMNSLNPEVTLNNIYEAFKYTKI